MGLSTLTKRKSTVSALKMVMYSKILPYGMVFMVLGKLTMLHCFVSSELIGVPDRAPRQSAHFCRSAALSSDGGFLRKTSLAYSVSVARQLFRSNTVAAIVH